MLQARPGDQPEQAMRSKRALDAGLGERCLELDRGAVPVRDAPVSSVRAQAWM
jgi:hypothetical protein